MAATEIRLQLGPDQGKPGVCRGCRAAIEWYKTDRQRAMPMNAGAKPLRTMDLAGDGTVLLGVFSSGDSHWATCPKREQFKKPAPPHRAYFYARYEPSTSRWHWTIEVNTNNHAKEVARSTITYPTEHDANVAWKAVFQSLRHGEEQLARTK